MQGSYFVVRTPGFCTEGTKMAFWLSGKVVALHLDNGPAKAYLFNQGGAALGFPFETSQVHFKSWLICMVSIFGYIYLPISMWKLPITGKVGSRVAPSSSYS